MNNKKNSKIPYREKNEENSEPCSVDKDSFPCIGKCCQMNKSAVDNFYEAICQRCEVWKSLPDSDSLKVVTIIECGLYGYGKRLEEK